MVTNRIPYTKPSITELEVEFATDAARNGWGENCYDYIIRFEEEFKKHLGVKHAIATSSCTGALHMGLHALGIKNGDEVILSDINWIATVAPVIHLGATPVLVDIEPDSWCLDPAQVEAAISPRTKAIIAVHLYGNLCDMSALRSLGEKHGIPIIEDAAEAIGSCYFDRRAGSMGRFGAFSFHGTKTITTGEGGMFVTNDSDLYEYVMTLSNHGRHRDQHKQFWPDTIGFKYKMSNIQAAVGCAQLKRIEELMQQKRKIFMTYKAALESLPLTMNIEKDGCVNGYWMPTIVTDNSLPFRRDILLEELKEAEVDARVFFWPLSMIIENAKFDPSKLKTANSIHSRGINLPSGLDITEEQIHVITDVISRHIRRLIN